MGQKLNIPKTIHYFWFGKGKKPFIIKSCIKSWKKYLPDYEIIEWNEENFDIQSNLYVREAYKQGKWAFVSDYARLRVLYEYGGIYLDTDVEILQSLDRFHSLEGFMSLGIYENGMYLLDTSLIGAKKENRFIEKQLRYYDDANFEGKDIEFNINNCTMTDICIREMGFKLENEKQQLEEMTIFPKGYFQFQEYANHYGTNSWVVGMEQINHLKKTNQYYFLMKRWLDVLVNNQIELSTYRDKKLTIYGKGHVGELLFQYLKNNGIEVVTIIDKNLAGYEYKDLKILGPDAVPNINTDYIIITPVYHFEEIYAELRNYTKSHIIGVDDFLGI